jgi:hypothetical protein
MMMQPMGYPQQQQPQYMAMGYQQQPQPGMMYSAGAPQQNQYPPGHPQYNNNQRGGATGLGTTAAVAAGGLAVGALAAGAYMEYGGGGFPDFGGVGNTMSGFGNDVGGAMSGFGNDVGGAMNDIGGDLGGAFDSLGGLF